MIAEMLTDNRNELIRKMVSNDIGAKQEAGDLGQVEEKFFRRELDRAIQTIDSQILSDLFVLIHDVSQDDTVENQYFVKAITRGRSH